MMPPLRHPAKTMAPRSLVVVLVRLVFNGTPRPGVARELLLFKSHGARGAESG
jgi:hypothetical protein